LDFAGTRFAYAINIGLIGKYPQGSIAEFCENSKTRTLAVGFGNQTMPRSHTPDPAPDDSGAVEQNEDKPIIILLTTGELSSILNVRRTDFESVLP
jgi:hypothetical protein